LAEFVTLLGRYKALEYVADGFVIELGEVELMDLIDERAPMRDGVVGGEWDTVANGGVVLTGLNRGE
jgi:hypothetical protein